MAKKSIYHIYTALLTVVFLIAQIGVSAHAADLDDRVQHNDCTVCHIVSDDYDGDDMTAPPETSVSVLIVYEAMEARLITNGNPQVLTGKKRARAPPKNLV